ncbi:diguanylate cyclase [Budviciaceae bacterium CWB-B4]|uniref:Diguanylate cyclase n=1 Tax=Limnobaculum xujianqingii TaxID=2738837 RepID=A0A9D7ALH4_9GAMM|nr:diguanylate cyclase [Limnobaculum xujianqingii]MBK5074990.1 diguanylate cyclase [Limnobaculum xujianqingii]MBK5178300.1 diguanylate cyclase [Limnobaculum xujianqingii]
MIPVRLPNTEKQRIEILKSLQILDTPPSEQLDRVTRLAADFFNVPIALVTLIDSDRQWFKSCFGLSLTETSRDISVCSHAIMQRSVFVVPDLRKDPRFCHIPPVVEAPHLVFYAGCQIHSRQGIPLGTLCIIDSKKHKFSHDDERKLSDFAKIVEQYFHSLEETTYTRKVEDNLSNTESMFAQTFNQAAVGMANVSLTGQWLRVNPKLCELLGYPEPELLNKTFQEITYPDDLNTDLGLLQDVLDGKIETYTIEKRYITKQKHIFWVLLTVSMVKNSQGMPHHFISIIVDINDKVSIEYELKKLTDELEIRVKDRTEQLERMLHLVNEEVEQRIETQNLLNIEKERLKEITDNVPALVSCVNHQLHYTFNNKTYEDWFGLQTKNIIGMYMPDVIGKTSFRAAQRYIEKVIAGQKVSFENTLPTKEGLKYVQTTLIPNRDREQGEFYILSLDITELKQLQQTLIFEASHDMLTNLPNRRSFIETLNNMLLDPEQHTWLALFFLDLDGFKGINDSYGHEFGDKVLQTVAEIICKSVRQNDMAARLAGDEFTILFSHPDNPQHIVSAISQRLLQGLAEVTHIDQIPVRLSASIGIAIGLNDDLLKPETLLSLADKAMYQAKQLGKGTFCIEYHS